MRVCVCCVWGRGERWGSGLGAGGLCVHILAASIDMVVIVFFFIYFSQLEHISPPLSSPVEGAATFSFKEEPQTLRRTTAATLGSVETL